MDDASFVRLYANVMLPADAQVDDFCVIGKPPRGKASGELATIFGAGCVIRSHTVIYAGNLIGVKLQTGHAVLIREENVIGDNVSIGSQSVVEHHVRIGNGVRLHTRVFVPEYSVLEDGCWLGPGVVVTNARYPVSPGVKETLRGAYIERGAIIGAAAVLLPGVQIGARALIGAGAVVTKDVAPGAVVVGNPGRVIKFIHDIDEYRD